MFGMDDLFDLDGNGERNGVETAFAYSVVFGNEKEHENSERDQEYVLTEGDAFEIVEDISI